MSAGAEDAEDESPYNAYGHCRTCKMTRVGQERIAKQIAEGLAVPVNALPCGHVLTYRSVQKRGLGDAR